MGIILIRKKICVSYFVIRNPYMKFQNPSMHQKVYWMDGCLHNMPLQLLLSWGHKNNNTASCSVQKSIHIYALLTDTLANHFWSENKKNTASWCLFETYLPYNCTCYSLHGVFQKNCLLWYCSISTWSLKKKKKKKIPLLTYPIPTQWCLLVPINLIQR